MRNRHSIVGIVVAVTVSVWGSLAVAQPAPVPPEAKRVSTPGIWGKSLAGGQLGPWFAQDFGNDIRSENVRLDASSTAFHLEFFYQPHLAGILNLDFNLGAISRGDLRVRTESEVALGDATLYPLSAGVALFPLARNTSLRFQPTVRAGGSLIIGTERIQIESVDYWGIGFDAESRTAWGYYLGGGGNIVLAPSVSLTGLVKYQQAEFKEELYGVRDFSGIQVLIGAAYMY